MKWFSFLIAGLLAATMLGTGVGCNKGQKNTVTGKNGETMTVTAPGDTSVKQGDTTSITIAVVREKFNDPVDLTFSGLPEGVTIMETDKSVGKDAKSAKLTLKAAPDAKLVDNQPVKMTASSGTMKTEETFKVTVKKGSESTKNEPVKQSLTVTGPANTSVTQGDTTTVNVNVTRDKFNDPVTISFKDLPKGVHVMEKDMVISKDANSAKFTLHADPDANVVDDQNVTINAAGGGFSQDVHFKLSVKKK